MASRRLLMLMVAAATMSCDGSTETPSPPAAIEIVSGAEQTGTVGQPLAQPVVVRVIDARGAGVGGVVVTWAVTAGGGSLSAASTTSGGDGSAELSWTVGTTSGVSNNTITATVAGLAGSPVAISASSSAGPATQFDIVSGDGQTAPAGTAIPDAPRVRIVDEYGNGVPGAPVRWDIVVGNGSVPAATVETASDGVATTQWTLGRFAGAQTMTATATAMSASPLRLSATATPNGTIGGTITLGSSVVAWSAAAEVAAERSDASGPRTTRHGELGSRDVRPPITTADRLRPVADELIVTFRPDAVGAPTSRALAVWRSTAPAVAGSIRAVLGPREVIEGFRVAGVSPAVMAARVRVGDPARREMVAANLRRHPAVARVEENGRRWSIGRTPARESVARPPFRAPDAATSDPLYSWQAWHYAMLGLPRAWETTRGSAGVLVAVVDDGIRFDHADIGPNLTSDGYDFVSNRSELACSGQPIGVSGDGDGYDPDPTISVAYDFDSRLDCVSGPSSIGGHGLHVAGTIGAVGNNGTGGTGVNWTVRIRPVRVIDALGSGTDYDVAQGILYAAGLPADNGAGGTVTAPTGARIINLSLGGPSQSSVMLEAVTRATAAGSLIVAAAGNDGSPAAHYPAAYADVLSVSAVGPDGKRAFYSSFGSTVDIAAPGGESVVDCSFLVISTTWNFLTNSATYDCLQGTSMAAPHVSGVAALILAQNPGLGRAELRARLTDFAVDVGAPGRDDSYGAGIVNARNSLTLTLGSPRQLYARVYDATTGAIVATEAVGANGAYTIGALADGTYLVYAGEDADGDAQPGLPGRRWSGFGGVVPTPITVSGSGLYPASFPAGIAIEAEANGTLAEATFLPLRGHVVGTTIGDGDVDWFRMVIPTAGRYTFETSPVSGACGFALEEDTILELYDAGGALLAANDDVDAGRLERCSRITAQLSPGRYHLRVRGHDGDARYVLHARESP